MKKIVLMFFLIFQTYCFGQKTLSGFFTNSKEDRGFESDYFEFKKDGSFKYAFFNCTEMSFGKGKYEITKSDVLFLNFEKTDGIFPQNQLNFDYAPSDSLKINIKTIDGQDKLYVSQVYFIFNNTDIGFVSDRDGIAKANFKLSNIKNIINIKGIGYNEFNLIIPDGATSIEGNLLMYPNFKLFEEKDVKSYRLKRLNDSSFNLNRYKSRNINYIKATKHNFIEAIKFKIGEFYYNSYLKKIVEN